MKIRQNNSYLQDYSKIRADNSPKSIIKNNPYIIDLSPKYSQENNILTKKIAEKKLKEILTWSVK